MWTSAWHIANAQYIFSLTVNVIMITVYLAPTRNFALKEKKEMGGTWKKNHHKCAESV